MQAKDVFVQLKELTAKRWLYILSKMLMRSELSLKQDYKLIARTELSQPIKEILERNTFTFSQETKDLHMTIIIYKK